MVHYYIYIIYTYGQRPSQDRKYYIYTHIYIYILGALTKYDIILYCYVYEKAWKMP